MERVTDIPFDSERKMMTTIHKIPKGYRIITKGAPDVLLKHCTKIYENDKISNLNSGILEKIERLNNKMADKALRVLAIAYLDVENLPIQITSEQFNLL